MANEVEIINGVTKREDSGVFRYTAAGSSTSLVADNTNLFVTYNIQEPGFLFQDKKAFSDITDKLGTSTPEEYCDELANIGAFFLLNTQITGTFPLPTDASTLTEQQNQSTLLGTILTVLGNILAAFAGLATELKQNAIIALQTTLNSIVSTSAKQDSIINAIKFSDDGIGNQYSFEVEDYQANATDSYGLLAVRLKDGETRDVFLHRISPLNQNSDDYGIRVYEYNRGQIPSIMNDALINYTDIGESCEFSVVTQDGGQNTAGIINTAGELKPGGWVSRQRRSEADMYLKIKMRPDREYLIFATTLSNGSDIYVTATILEKPLTVTP